MTHVLITGAHGFIARHLAPTLSAAGMAVTGTSRSATTPRGFERVHACRLGDSLADILRAERPDVVVHAALDSGPDAYAANVEGTRRWLREASAAGVRLQVFLSSLSALPDAPSDYGRAKFDGEQDFVAADAVVLRMGVVIGPGGMFERLVNSSRRFPATPLLDGGRQWVYVLGIDFLCAALTDCIAADHRELCGRTWNLQQPKPYTLRQIVESINRAYGFRRVLVPIPARPILTLTRLAEGLSRRLRLPQLPISSANIEGLLRQGRQAIPSDFSRFGYPEQSLDALIDAAKPRQGE